MTIKGTLEQLRAKRIFNSYDFYGDHPYISCRAKAGYRDVLPSMWRVHKRGVSLSDTWYDYGAKSFSYGGRENKARQLAAAQEWASARFGITEWKRDPFGSYGAADYVTARLRELLESPQAHLGVTRE